MTIIFGIISADSGCSKKGDVLWAGDTNTGEETGAIWEFIEEIAITIWEVHEDKILEASNIIEPTPEIPEPEDDRMYVEEDDIPF